MYGLDLFSGIGGLLLRSALGLDQSLTANYYGWTSEPCLCRGNHGVSNRVDRIKCLGNAVVPLQAREAFKILAGYQ